MNLSSVRTCPIKQNRMIDFFIKYPCLTDVYDYSFICQSVISPSNFLSFHSLKFTDIYIYYDGQMVDKYQAIVQIKFPFFKNLV